MQFILQALLSDTVFDGRTPDALPSKGEAPSDTVFSEVFLVDDVEPEALTPDFAVVAEDRLSPELVTGLLDLAARLDPEVSSDDLAEPEVQLPEGEEKSPRPDVFVGNMIDVTPVAPAAADSDGAADVRPIAQGASSGKVERDLPNPQPVKSEPINKSTGEAIATKGSASPNMFGPFPSEVALPKPLTQVPAAKADLRSEPVETISRSERTVMTGEADLPKQQVILPPPQRTAVLPDAATKQTLPAAIDREGPSMQPVEPISSDRSEKGRLAPILLPVDQNPRQPRAAEKRLTNSEDRRDAPKLVSRDFATTIVPSASPPPVSVHPLQPALETLPQREVAPSTVDQATGLVLSETEESRRQTTTASAQVNQLAKTVVTQVSNLVARSNMDGVIEVRLSPEELGRVKLSMSQSEAGVVVHITAERQETLDLMRRNIDLLESDLREQGFANLSFSFGQNGSGERQDEDATSGSGGDLEHSTGLQADLISAPATAQDGRLDIRL